MRKLDSLITNFDEFMPFTNIIDKHIEQCEIVLSYDILCE